MTNELSVSQGKLNETGDLITSKTEEGGAIKQTVKYGIIKLMGDKNEYRVSYKTLYDIVNKPEKFNGNVVIPELHMKVPLNSIVFQQFRDEEITINKDFTRLPYERLVCEPTPVGQNFKPTDLSESAANKTRSKFWLASLHYTIGPDGQKLFDCNFNHAKEALFMVPVMEENYPPSINKIFRYGNEQIFGEKR